MIEINLYEEASHIDLLKTGILASRKTASELFTSQLDQQYFQVSLEEQIVSVYCSGISEATSSFIDQLFFIEIYAKLCNKNTVLLLHNLSSEFLYNLNSAAAIKAKLIAEAKKEKRYAHTIKERERLIAKSPESAGRNWIIGSPYLLLRLDSKIVALGLSENEILSKTVSFIWNNKYSVTAKDIASAENTAINAVSNRLKRLYEKNLVFRKKLENSKTEYIYYSI